MIVEYGTAIEDAHDEMKQGSYLREYKALKAYIGKRQF